MPTQAERTAGTRRALLDATVLALVDLGYAGTSTTEVCRRAGVSQGALFRHFPTKAALLAAAVEDLFPRLLDRFERGAKARATTDPSVLIDLLHGAYGWPEVQAATELYAAARTDADLTAALAVVEPPHRARLHALAASLLPGLADHPRFTAAVDVVVDATQGAAARLQVLPVDERTRALAAQRQALTEIVTALATTQPTVEHR